MNLKEILASALIVFSLAPAPTLATPAFCRPGSSAPTHHPFDLVWINNHTFTFQDRAGLFQPGSMIQAQQMKFSPGRPEEADGTKRFNPLSKMSQIGFLKPVLGLKDRYMEPMKERLENREGSFFIPYFSSEGESRKPRNSSSEKGFQSAPFKSEERNERQAAQERYYVGYRLNGVGGESLKDWFLGLGFRQSGGSGGEMKGPGGKFQKKESSGQPQPVRKDFRGPIVGLQGKF